MPKLIYHDSDGVDKVLMLASEPILIGRATYVCQRAQERADLNSYWYGVHNLNTDSGAADEFLKSYGQELKFKPVSQD